MKNSTITVIPSTPGFFTLYENEGAIEHGEPIIAWQIKTVLQDNNVTAITYPVVTTGDPAMNFIGILRPDGKIDNYDGTWQDMESFAAYVKSTQ